MTSLSCPPSQRTLLTVLVIAALLVTGVANNVGGSMMSYVMPVFPAWLLYATTALYTLGFLLLALVRKEGPFGKENRSWDRQKIFVLLGMLTVGNGICFQFAAAWVGGAISQILANMTIVQIIPLEFVWLRVRHSVREWAGTLVVLLGIVLGLAHVLYGMFTKGAGSDITEQSNKWYWILTFLLSTTFNAGVQVGEDIAFKNKKIPVATTLFWYNLYSLPWYTITIFLECVPVLNGTYESVTVADSFRNQGQAFECYVQAYHSPGRCLEGATLWPTVFVVGYVGMFFFQGILIKWYGVLHANLIGVLVQFLSILAFSMEWLVGTHTVTFSWFPVLGCVVIVLGLVAKGAPKHADDEEGGEGNGEEGAAIYMGESESKYGSSTCATGDDSLLNHGSL